MIYLKQTFILVHGKFHICSTYVLFCHVFNQANEHEVNMKMSQVKNMGTSCRYKAQDQVKNTGKELCFLNSNS